MSETLLNRVTQSGGMGGWRCNTCGEDCCAGAGCENPDYPFTPSYWPADDGEYLLIPVKGIPKNDLGRLRGLLREYGHEDGLDKAMRLWLSGESRTPYD